MLIKSSTTACGGANETIRMGIPGGDWSRAELFARARWEHSRIDNGETYSPRYWFLGRALRELRKDLAPPIWRQWRKANRLDRTRCDRAQLLARAFDTPDEVEHLPLLQALAVASERLGLTRRRMASDTRFRRWLKLTKARAESRLNELSEVAAPGELRPYIADLTYTLLEFDRACLAAENAHAGDR